MSHQDHVLPISVYVKTYIVLLVLMFVTVAVALLPHWIPAMYHMSLLNNLIAMGVAITKAILVILFFMHVKFSTRLTQLFAALGFAWFTILFIGLLDYMTRRGEATRGWEDVPANALPRVRGEPGT
jgi:cytochrome c oxidase subunit 4